MNTVTKMNQFRIECSEINYFTILVEAETEDEARELAHKDINSFEVEDEYVSVLPLPWIMEQTYSISKWCLSRMKVNFVEEPESMFDDLREIGPTFLLLGPRVWEQIAAEIRSKIMDSSYIKRKLFNFLQILKNHIAGL